MSRIKIGQKVIYTESGVIGTVEKFYSPTACEEQTMVRTGDGRQYHAPTRTWVPYTDGLESDIVIFDEGHSVYIRHASPIELLSYQEEIMKKLYSNFLVNHSHKLHIL